MNLYLFSMGLITAFVVDAVWRQYFYGLFTLNISDRLRIIEHYHWGLLAIIIYLITGVAYALGLGAGLVIAESLQENPFAMGKKYFIQSSIIGLIETIIIIYLSILYPP